MGTKSRYEAYAEKRKTKKFRETKMKGALSTVNDQTFPRGMMPVYVRANLMPDLTVPSNNSIDFISLPVNILVDLSGVTLQSGDGDLLQLLRDAADVDGTVIPAINEAWQAASNHLNTETAKFNDLSDKTGSTLIKDAWAKVENDLKAAIEGAFGSAQTRAQNALEAKLQVRADAAKYEREVTFQIVMGVAGTVGGAISIATAPFSGPASVIGAIALAKSVSDTVVAINNARQDAETFMFAISTKIETLYSQYGSEISTVDELKDSALVTVKGLLPLSWVDTFDSIKTDLNTTLYGKITRVDVSCSKAYIKVNEILDSSEIVNEALGNWLKNNEAIIKGDNDKKAFHPTLLRLAKQISDTYKETFKGMLKVVELTNRVKRLWKDYYTVRDQFKEIDENRSTAAQVYNVISNLTTAGMFIGVGQTANITGGSYTAMTGTINDVATIMGATGDVVTLAQAALDTKDGLVEALG